MFFKIDASFLLRAHGHQTDATPGTGFGMHPIPFFITSRATEWFRARVTAPTGTTPNVSTAYLAFEEVMLQNARVESSRRNIHSLGL